MKKFKSNKQESRTDWGTDFEDGINPNLEQIRTGAILRIADAAEKMANNYGDLIRERDRYKSRYEGQLEESRRLAKSIAGLRGLITKLKKAQTNP